jgi:hypothetical protein
VPDEHGGAGGLSLGRGGIRRSVVDDEDRQVDQRLADDVPDPGRLVEGRDQGEDAAAPSWPDRRAVLSGGLSRAQPAAP